MEVNRSYLAISRDYGAEARYGAAHTGEECASPVSTASDADAGAHLLTDAERESLRAQLAANFLVLAFHREVGARHAERACTWQGR